MDKGVILQKFSPSMENVLLILHEFQNHHPQHYLSENDLAMVAEYLSVPYSAIYGVVSYYSMFSLKPRGKHIIRVCHSPVCQMTDSNVILAQLRSSLAVYVGATTADGLFTLETTECLGQCDTAPGMSIDEQYFGNLNAKKIKKIIRGYQNQNG